MFVVGRELGTYLSSEEEEGWCVNSNGLLDCCLRDFFLKLSKPIMYVIPKKIKGKVRDRERKREPKGNCFKYINTYIDHDGKDGRISWL